MSDRLYPQHTPTLSLGLLCLCFLVSSTSSFRRGASRACCLEQPDKVADLIVRLGDDDFENRNSAEARLEEIGAPAMPQLRKAAISSDDAEIRLRSYRLIEVIAVTMAKTEAAKWQGRWENGDQLLIIKKDYWWWGSKRDVQTAKLKKNRLHPLEVTKGFTKVNLTVELGPSRGKTCQAIFRLEGDALRYSGSYKTRPKGFADPHGYAIEWKRVKE